MQITHTRPVAGALAIPAVFLAVLLAVLPRAGARADTLEALRLDGLAGQLANNARSHLSLAKLAESGEDRLESYLRYQLAQGRDEIRAALEPFGHYRPEIEAGLEPGDAPGAWIARYTVDPGPQVRFGEITVTLGEADDDEEIAAAQARLTPEPGAPFTHAAYEGAKRGLLNVLARRGYFENRIVEQRAVVDPDAGTADVTLVFASGPRYRFGPTRFEGSQFSEAFMRRFGVLPVGEPYRAEELRALQLNLSQVAYFAEAFVEPRIAEANETLEVPVRVTTIPAKRRRYTAGINFGTDTGVGVEGTALWRWINSRGHSVEAEAEFGTRNRRLVAGYKIPGPDLDTSYTLSGGYRYTVTDAYTEELVFLSGTRARRLWGWDLTESITLIDEEFEIGDQTATRDYLLGSLTAERSAYDNRMFTRRGWRVLATIHGTSEAVLSDFGLLQFDLNGTWITSFGERNRLLLRGRLGASLIEEISQIPASLRFFSGGDRSVRGFDFESLGPRNEDGVVIGGANVILASATFEHYFLEDWGIAGFVDAGNAFDDEEFVPALGVGGGARWRSPVGLVRLDFAVGFEEDQDDEVYRLHLNIGPDL